MLCTALVGCANSEGATIEPVVVRTPDGAMPDNSEALASYYRTVFARMRDALRGGTRDSLAELRYLILQHKRDGMVAFARQQIERYELLADGLEFELDLPDLCELVSTTASPHAHGKQSFELRVRGYRDRRVLELGGSATDAAGFQVRVRVRDFDASGQFVESTQNLPLAIGRRYRLVDDQTLQVPFEVPGASPHVAIRELSMVVELLPGVVTVDGRRLPVSQFAEPSVSRLQVEELPAIRKLTRGPGGHAHCCALDVIVYPEGYEAIQKAPSKTLQNAISRGQSKWFRHVFLACHFMPAADRPAAMTRLMQWVRNGTAQQSIVAMGCLRLLSRKDLPVTDRDAWLRWWQSRPRQPK